MSLSPVSRSVAGGLFILFMLVPAFTQAQTWAGAWTTYTGNNKVTLDAHQTGTTVTGDIVNDAGERGTISGELSGNLLTGRWVNTDRDNVEGRFRWDMSESGMSFTGTFGMGEEDTAFEWNGSRTITESDEDFDVIIKVDTSFALFSYELATGGKTCASVGVECVGPNVSANNSALNMAGHAIDLVNMKWGAWRAASRTFSLSKDVLTAMYPDLETSAEVVELIRRYLESDTWQALVRSYGEYAAGQAGSAAVEDDFWSQQLGENIGEYLYNEVVPDGESASVEKTYHHTGCGDLVVLYGLRATENGVLRKTFLATGNCQCKWPKQGKLGKWTVLGGLDLAPRISVDGDTIVVTYGRAGTNYRVESETC